MTDKYSELYKDANDADLKSVLNKKRDPFITKLKIVIFIISAFIIYFWHQDLIIELAQKELGFVGSLVVAALLTLILTGNEDGPSHDDLIKALSRKVLLSEKRYDDLEKKYSDLSEKMDEKEIELSNLIKELSDSIDENYLTLSDKIDAK